MKRSRITLDDGYLPLTELATYSGLSVRTLRDYLHDPVAPLPHFLQGGKIVVRRSEYDDWMQRFRVQEAGADVTAVLEAMVRRGE
jgi:hypothetical protein